MLTVNKENDFRNELPNSPGVYLFYETPDALPLYIGKSINIRKRVLSHFYSAKSDPKEERLMSKVNHIEWKVTAGEIGALILEANLIKEKLPLHNKRSRRTQRLYSFYFQKKENFIQPQLIQHRINDVRLRKNCYGLFRSQRQANQCFENLIKKHQLCRKALGLEKVGSSCFAYQLKNCKGACIGDESSISHNLRLEEAFAQYQQHIWPYQGPIGIIEKNNDNDIQSIYLIENWIYIGTINQIDKAEIDKLLSNKLQDFDADIYKILVRALAEPANHIIEF